MSSLARRFKPLADRVLVQPVKLQTKTASGLHLSEAAIKAQDGFSGCKGTVIAVGSGRLEFNRNDELVKLPMTVKVGDTVLMPEYGGMQIKFDDETYKIFRDEDLVGICTEE